MQFIKYSHFYLHALSFFYIFSPTGTSQFLRTNKVLHYIVCNGVRGRGWEGWGLGTNLRLPDHVNLAKHENRLGFHQHKTRYRETTNQHKACIEKLSSIQIYFFILHSNNPFKHYSFEIRGKELVHGGCN